MNGEALGEAIGRARQAIDRRGLARVVCSGLAYMGGGLSRHKGLLAVVLIAGGGWMLHTAGLPEIHWPQWQQSPPMSPQAAPVAFQPPKAAPVSPAPAPPLPDGGRLPRWSAAPAAPPLLPYRRCGGDFDDALLGKLDVEPACAVECRFPLEENTTPCRVAFVQGARLYLPPEKNKDLAWVTPSPDLYVQFLGIDNSHIGEAISTGCPVWHPCPAEFVPPLRLGYAAVAIERFPRIAVSTAGRRRFDLAFSNQPGFGDVYEPQPSHARGFVPAEMLKAP
jgi:hypothetical protein